MGNGQSAHLLIGLGSNVDDCSTHPDYSFEVLVSRSPTMLEVIRQRALIG
jgi:hypothetical protein